MITKNDVIILLTDLQEKGVNVDAQLRNVITNGVSYDIIEFVNTNRQMDLHKFYEKIRKSYNDKHSNLYINIVKEIENPEDVLTTLSAMQTQIILFANKLEDKSMFLRHARIAEISKVLYNYFTTKDISPCIKLIQLIKADIKFFQRGKNK